MTMRLGATVGFLGLGQFAAAGPPASTPEPTHAEPLVVRVDDGAFRWGDAGIGAVAGFGTALVLSGSLVLVGRRHRPPALAPGKGKQ